MNVVDVKPHYICTYLPQKTTRVHFLIDQSCFGDLQGNKLYLIFTPFYNFFSSCLRALPVSTYHVNSSS